ncbi:MAG: fumarylacetoacetate hydrolase family protein [Deltaproteobacteria bacterium]|nr:fumarylacetoacetate hydrolase family protein [Deltaproteobacteria bacterium]
MRLATIKFKGEEHLAICQKSEFFRIKDLNKAFQSQWPDSMDILMKTDQLFQLNKWYGLEGKYELDKLQHLFINRKECTYAPLYRHPSKIWGIGLNYRAHAKDLSEKPPTSAPASFMKPDTTIIGHGDEIKIPPLSQKTTAEAELGIIIGKRCKNVSRGKWLDVIAGFTTILDMTAEDILVQNPRFLTMSKSFDTFFSFGPQLVTPDEIADVSGLHVSTVINETVHAENTVDHMTFTPDVLVSYHTRVMTLLPGDVISTGTPGAIHIHHGDIVQCQISGFKTLENPVIDLKQP